MAFAALAPIAGAALGGSVAGQIGMGVGWMIGSWLTAPKQQDKNEIFDPGAQEMPRFNNSLRGITMPVLFGTNRVSSQIVWQHDFNTIRKETNSGSGGGGKFGGSGMKGGAGQQSTNVSYQYKWDLIYHLGMVPQPYSIYGGWLGPDKLSADTILAITNNAANSYNVFFGFANEDAIAQKASLVFEEGFFYQGYGPGNDGSGSWAGWDELNTDEATTIRWPHTTWIGFKQMDLGSAPHIPQLSFEIGPGAPEITFNSAYYGSAARLSLSANTLPSGHFITGDNGQKYLIAGTGQGGSICCSIYRFEESSSTYVLNRTITAAQFDTFAGANLDPGSAYTFTTLPWAAAIPESNFFLCGALDVGAALRANHATVMFKINSAGSVEAVGGCQYRSNSLNPRGNILQLGISNEGTSSDPLLGFGVTFTGGVDKPYIRGFPSQDAMNGNWLIGDTAANEYDGIAHEITSNFSNNFGAHNSYRDFTSFGWFVPSVSVGLLGPTWSSRWYFYVGKSDIEAHIDDPGNADAASYITGLTGTYPNGFAGYMTIGTCTDGVSTPTIPAPSGPTIDNDNFVGLYDTNARVPFDDAGTNNDGTVDDDDDYHPSPTVIKVTKGQAQGAYAVLFTKCITGSEDMDPTGDYTKVRGFIYNPLSGQHQEFGDASGSPWDTVSDIGATSPTRYSHVAVERRAVLNQTTGVLFIWDNKEASNSDLNQTHFGELGTFDIGGGSDVVPPYIIYEILTNGWFGLGKVAADIDQSSYEQAILYCQSQGFYVSTQYRRDQNALDIIEELLSVYGGFLIISNGKIKFRQLEYLDGGDVTPRTIDNHHLLADPGQVPVSVTKGAKQDTFNKIRVNYQDRNIDYQQNQVEETDEVDQDLYGIRMREFPATFVMSEATARKMAWRSLWSNLYARDTYSFKLGWKDADLEPGDLVTLVDSYHPNLAGGTTARIVQWKEESRGVFSVTAKQEFDYVLSGSASALDVTSASAQDLVSIVPKPAYFRAYELPAEFQQTDNGAIYVGWVPEEFAAGAFLWISPDGVTFAEAAHVTPYALGGQVLTAMPAMQPGAVQENVEVLLFPKSDYYDTSCVYFNATLQEAGPSVRAVGGSLMWVGSEMVAYETVTLVSQNRYRLSKVYRGWGETLIGNHSSGDFWWKHGGGVFAQDINEDKIGTVIQYKVQPHNLGGVRLDIDSIDAQTYTIVGAHYLPQVAPTPRLVIDSVDLRGKETVFVNSTTNIAIDWKDTARKSGYGIGGYGIGLYGRFNTDPQSHSWRVEVVGSGDTIVRSTEVSTATFTYTSSQNFEDNGAWRGNVAFKVTPFSAAGDAPRTEVLSLELW